MDFIGYSSREEENIMEKIFCVALVVGCVSMSAGTVESHVTPLGGASYEYNFILSGFAFQPHEELDVRFDPATFIALSNGVGPSGYNVVVLQPNNPPGVAGDYTALALIANPSTAGSFSVQAVYSGPGKPGSLPFFLEQFNSDDVFVSTVSAGFTTPVTATSDVPEPATLTLVSASLILGGLWMLRRLRRHESEGVNISDYAVSTTSSVRSVRWRQPAKSSMLIGG
jgi:hypothetical protein